MRIFKFGGASIKDAAGIKNVHRVLQKVGYEDVLLVISGPQNVPLNFGACQKNSWEFIVQKVCQFHPMGLCMGGSKSCNPWRSLENYRSNK